MSQIQRKWKRLIPNSRASATVRRVLSTASSTTKTTKEEDENIKNDDTYIRVEEGKTTQQQVKRSNSFERDRENVTRGLLLVAREIWLQSKEDPPMRILPSAIFNAKKAFSEQSSKLNMLHNDTKEKLEAILNHQNVAKKQNELHNYDPSLIMADMAMSNPLPLSALSSNKATIQTQEAVADIAKVHKPPTHVKNDNDMTKKKQEKYKRDSSDDESRFRFEDLPKPEEPNAEKMIQENFASHHFREANVPSTPLARAFGFSSLFTGLAIGTIAEATRRATGFSQSSGTSSWVSDANADRLASTLCRMRGAALKLGQMLSIQDESVLPAPLAAALDRVRAGADRMPNAQLDAVMSRELGTQDWEKVYFSFFDRNPIAAASLGQVHRAVLKDSGKEVVLKIQYPGVAESIESDVANLRRLVRLTGIFPRGLFIDKILDVVGSELKEECDYEKEASHQIEMARLLKDDPSFQVPFVIKELSTRRVLTMELVKGIPLDKVAELSQGTRDRVGRMLLRLTLRELFEFGYVQSDPNFANYFYDPISGKLWLLDFGATKNYADEFVDIYAELVWAAAEGDRDTLIRRSIDVGLLNGRESREMLDAHAQAAFDIAEPFSRKMKGGQAYDFGNSKVTSKVARHGPTFMRDRLVPPPQEIYSLHRKLSGAFMACVRIKSKFPCRDILEASIKKRLGDKKKRDLKPDTVATSTNIPK